MGCVGAGVDGGKILVGVVVKGKVDELEDDVRVVFSRRMRKEFDGVMQVLYRKGRLLVRI